MRKRRTIYDVIADVLEHVVAAGETRISHISRYANLPLDRAAKLVERLRKAGLLREVAYRGYRAYRPTRNSYVYLAHYRELRKLIAPLEHQL